MPEQIERVLDAARAFKRGGVDGHASRTRNLALVEPTRFASQLDRTLEKTAIHVLANQAGGCLGLVAGIGALALIDLLPPTDMFAHREVDMKVALGATPLLVIAGALAGQFPARAAARVNAIQG